MANMNEQLIAAKKLAALLAAGGSAASGTPAAPAEPVEPAPETPVEIVEEVPSETEKTDMENQVDQAIADMEEGKDPVIIIEPSGGQTENEGEAEIQQPEETEKENAEIKAEEPAASAPAETPKKEETGANTGKTVPLNDAQMSLLRKLAMRQKMMTIRNTGGSCTVPAPSVTTGNKAEANAPVIEDAESRNASVTDEQKAAVNGMLETYPSGTKWNDKTTYRGNTGCGAYVAMMADKVYGQKGAMDTVMTSYVREADIEANLKPYSVAHVNGGTHWVFILEVNEDGTFRAAEGNVGGRVSVGAVYSVDDITELYVK